MPVTYKQQRLSGWGNAPTADCTSFRPEKQRDLVAILNEHSTSVIARGLGRSYGDAALQPDGVIRCERLNHFIEFDIIKGTVCAQAGVSLAEIMELSIPRGWFPPVLPGTRHVTIGGAFACNVHGKNHWRDGDFAEHVESIRITLASGENVLCSPSERKDLFWATAGGMGMTGIITEVTLRLRQIASASLMTTNYKVNSIDDMIAAFEHYREQSDYMVGWIDHMAKGDAIGRGVFEAANHMPTGIGTPLSEFVSMHTRFSVPFYIPSFVLNRYSMALYNKWRFRRYSEERQKEAVIFDGFFHPLDSIGHWNRLYGKRGFFQYQCLIPEIPDAAKNIRILLAALQRQGLFSFLAVIKYHRQGKGPMTFPVAGYSLAFDFPNTARVRKILPQINRWIAEHGGRVYLAKDALLTADVFDVMYQNHAQEWKSTIKKIDPDSRFTSLMSERLQWK